MGGIDEYLRPWKVGRHWRLLIDFYHDGKFRHIRGTFPTREAALARGRQVTEGLAAEKLRRWVTGER